MVVVGLKKAVTAEEKGLEKETANECGSTVGLGRARG